MINFYNQVPSVYNNASRDFQYISWLVNVVLNSVKHNVDDLYDLPNVKADPRLTELLAMTLGFKVKRNYDKKQLMALVSVIPSMLKYKGTQTAVEMACVALIRASGARGIYTINCANNCLEVQLPDNLVDTVLFTDLLPYILPAGLTVRLVTRTVIAPPVDSIELGYEDVVMADWAPDVILDTDIGRLTGLATLFEDSTLNSNATPEFANFKAYGNDKIINTGLLDNSIITDVTKDIKDSKTQHLAETKNEGN